jgi:hypothetical protein
MRKKSKKNLLHFLEKKKDEELTKVCIGTLSLTATRHPLPFDGTMIEGPYGTGTSSFATRMCFTLETSSSSSLTSYVKTVIYPNSLILGREVSVFSRKIEV